MTADHFVYRANRDVYIPAQQPEYRFLADLFARRTEFEEDIFYDVSTWTLPLAFDLQYSALNTSPATVANEHDPFPAVLGANVVDFSDEDVGYLIDWRSRYAPRTLYRLLDADIRVSVAHAPFQIEDAAEETEFSYGTLFVPLSHQESRSEQIQTILSSVPASEQTRVTAVRTSLTDVGIDLGSSRLLTLKKPRVQLVVGDGVSSYEAGEVWHLLDRRYDMPVTLVDSHRLGESDLSKQNTLVLVSGSYGSVSDSAVSRLKQWLANGGTLIAIGSAIHWLDRQKIIDVEFRNNVNEVEDRKSARLPYADAADTSALKLIKGAIFETHVDRTHPLGFGFPDDRLPVFRNNSVMLEPAKNPYSTPVLYTDQPLLSGYVFQREPGLAQRIRQRRRSTIRSRPRDPDGREPQLSSVLARNEPTVSQRCLLWVDHLGAEHLTIVWHVGPRQRG